MRCAGLGADREEKRVTNERSAFTLILANQAVQAACYGRDPQKGFAELQQAAIMPALEGIGPRDPLKGMLAGQLVAVHNAVMDCLADAQVPEQTFEDRQLNLSMVNTREVAAPPELGDAQLDGAGAGLSGPLSVAVAPHRALRTHGAVTAAPAPPTKEAPTHFRTRTPRMTRTRGGSTKRSGGSRRWSAKSKPLLPYSPPAMRRWLRC